MSETKRMVRNMFLTLLYALWFMTVMYALIHHIVPFFKAWDTYLYIKWVVFTASALLTVYSIVLPGAYLMCMESMERRDD